MRIEKGQKVKTKYGTCIVVDVFNFDDVGAGSVIVKAEDGSRYKVDSEDIEVIAESEPIEESITLTREEFKNMLIGVIGSLVLNNDSPELCIAITRFAPVVGAELEVALFGEQVENA